MKRIYFKKRKRSKALPILAFSLVLIITGGFITFLNKDTAMDITGRAIYEAGLYPAVSGQDDSCAGCADENPVSVAGYYTGEENTKEGLAIRYGEIKQSRVEIGAPVKWMQKLLVSNPGNEPARNALIQLETPPDAFNVNVFMYGARLSEGPVLKIPYFAPRRSLEMLLVFETSPIYIDFVEEAAPPPQQLDKEALIGLLTGTKTKLVIWHNSSMHYYNVPVEMDIKLGEKIVELSDGIERNIHFDYEMGRASWVISEI